MVGRGGSDWLKSGGGHDVAYGNGRRDHLFGWRGVDALHGGTGPDYLIKHRFHPSTTAGSSSCGRGT